MFGFRFVGRLLELIQLVLVGKLELVFVGDCRRPGLLLRFEVSLEHSRRLEGT